MSNWNFSWYPKLTLLPLPERCGLLVGTTSSGLVLLRFDAMLLRPLCHFFRVPPSFPAEYKKDFAHELFISFGFKVVLALCSLLPPPPPSLLCRTVFTVFQLRFPLARLILNVEYFIQDIFSFLAFYCRFCPSLLYLPPKQPI